MQSKTQRLAGTRSWILYDCGNSAFALLVQTAIFPIFFKSAYFTGELEDAESTYWLGVSASLASLLVALAAPFLGAVADLGGMRKKLLGVFLVIGLIATAAICFLGQGEWQMAAMLYVLALVGFSCGNLFYDALLPVVSHPGNQHRVSAQGFAAGYFGGTVALLLALVMIEGYDLFGFESKVLPTRLSFILVAVWWGLFAVPLFLKAPEGRSLDHQPVWQALKRTPGEVCQVIRKTLRYKAVWTFLLAYWFYIDGVNTLIKMASALGADLGFGTNDLILAIILVQVVGVPFALLGGWLGQKFGPRPIIAGGVIIYILVTIYASFMSAAPWQILGLSVNPIYVLAVGIGIAQGTVQSLSRSLFASVIPEAEAGAFFGLYNIVGKSAAVVGPFMVGHVALWSGSTQTGILSIVSLFVLGLVFLAFVPQPRQD